MCLISSFHSYRMSNRHKLKTAINVLNAKPVSTLLWWLFDDLIDSTSMPPFHFTTAWYHLQRPLYVLYMKYLNLTVTPTGSVTYFTISLNLFQRYCVLNLISKTLTLPAIRRKDTATVNKSNLNARMVRENILLLPVSMVIGLGFKVVQVRNVQLQQIHSFVILVGLI